MESKKKKKFLLVIGEAIFTVVDELRIFRCGVTNARAVNCLDAIGDVAIDTLRGR